MGSSLVFFAGIMLFAFVREPKDYRSSFEHKPELWATLKCVLLDPDKSALRIFLAHFFWVIALSAIEAFFTLYAKNHLGYPGAQGARILGQFPLTLLLFALPAGIAGGRFGRKRSILFGLGVLLSSLMAIYFLDREALTLVLVTLPVLGEVPVIGGLLMLCGCAWMMVNVNSLPMVVDMTDDLRAGTYTGICFLFVTAAAIAGPVLNGWIIHFSGYDYSSIFIASSVFVCAAFIIMTGVRRGEAKNNP